MQPELPIITWLLPDPLNRNIGCAQPTLYHQTEQALTAHVSYVEVAQMPRVPISATLPRSSGRHPWPHGGVPYDQPMEGEKEGLVYR